MRELHWSPALTGGGDLHHVVKVVSAGFLSHHHFPPSHVLLFAGKVKRRREKGLSSTSQWGIYFLFFGFSCNQSLSHFPHQSLL